MYCCKTGFPTQCLRPTIQWRVVRSYTGLSIPLLRYNIPKTDKLNLISRPSRLLVIHYVNDQVENYGVNVKLKRKSRKKGLVLRLLVEVRD